jgi:hypothetical protein
MNRAYKVKNKEYGYYAVVPVEELLRDVNGIEGAQCKEGGGGMGGGHFKLIFQKIDVPINEKQEVKKQVEGSENHKAARKLTLQENVKNGAKLLSTFDELELDGSQNIIGGCIYISNQGRVITKAEICKI